MHPSNLIIVPISDLRFPYYQTMPLSKLRKLAQQKHSGPVLVFPEVCAALF